MRAIVLEKFLADLGDGVTRLYQPGQPVEVAQEWYEANRTLVKPLPSGAPGSTAEALVAPRAPRGRAPVRTKNVVPAKLPPA